MVKDAYVNEIKCELESLKQSIEDEIKTSPSSYIHKTGVIEGLDLAIDLVKTYV